jgi:chemotaxis protein methyltransferase CheR
MMDRAVFNRFRTIVYEMSGISLNDTKEALVSARVAKRMRALGLNDYESYLQCVEDDREGHEMVQLIDVISTNVTSFFRESAHFDFLSEVVRGWMDEGQQRFRFWSAASSTGEEPYSMAMTLLEAAHGRSLDMRILATDISTSVLEHCRAGAYAVDKMAGVQPALRERYFTTRREARGLRFVAKDCLKNMISFHRLNLSKPPFPMRGPLDVVFCRNVMIYFDNSVRTRLLGEIYRLLKPGGYLMVGHAESLTGMMSEFKVLRPSIYVKR